MIRVLLEPFSEESLNRLDAIKDALSILKEKSKSFYVASMAFEGSLRLNLLSLYGICRAADDMIDEASSQEALETNITLLQTVFRAPQQNEGEKQPNWQDFPARYRPVLSLMPDLELPLELYQEMLHGFCTDAAFLRGKMPIQTYDDLRDYAEQVAGSVADMCVRLSWRAYGCHLSATEQRRVILKAREMGTISFLGNFTINAQAH